MGFKATGQRTKIRNKFCIVLDRSSSMNGLRAKTVEVLNRTVDDIKEQSKKHSQESTLTLITFSSQGTQKVEFEDVPIDQVKRSTIQDYIPGGMTCLVDACLLANKTMERIRKDASVVVFVITDGQENHSRNSPEVLSRNIRELQGTDMYTFVFQVPRRYKQYVTHLGIPSGNIQEWDQTEEGMEVITQATSVGTQSYFDDRAKGHTRSLNWYTTDASAVTTKDLRKLKNLQSKFKSWKVPKEVAIKDFVEEKTKSPYIPGSVFYQLTKTEKIQPQKMVLIMKKGGKGIYGGDEARGLIGLPASEDWIEAKVKPGNHANFEIFVQSSSINRKLVRGTKVLVMGA